MTEMKEPIIWERPHAPIDDAAIREVERRLGVTLPPDYVAIAKTAHGGHPSRSHITYEDPELGPFGTSMSLFLSLDPDYSDGLLSAFEMLSPWISKLVIPFGADAGGDYFCFDYRKTGPAGPPTVCYFAHENARAECLIPLTATFTELLEKLDEISDTELEDKHKEWLSRESDPLTRAKRPVVWDEPHEPLDDAAIRAIEHHLGVTLPADYVAVAKTAHGGHPSRSQIAYQDPQRGHSTKISMHELLSLDPEYDDGLFARMEYLADDHQLPKLIIPFGADDGDDYFCFDYRETGPSGPPTICYFAPEKARAPSLVSIASSFTELLERFEKVKGYR